ncbi:MAG: BlaI/MecI/CopY family transcriptional regulator [Oscillospiraceae bacterium]|nr:BlaI/MecI/CopY family transcriptional regulator [Oscillospiraceae bacterium]
MENLSEKISESELEVMRVLWEAGDALPVTDIRQILRERKGWEATTVKTLIQRLCGKGAIAQEKRKVFYYSPLVSEREYNDWAANDLVRRLFRGSAKELVATLVKSDGLSAADIDELREMFKVEE